MLWRLSSLCLRHRLLVVSLWLAAAVVGVAGAVRLTPLLGNGFSLPGTESSRVEQVLAQRYGQRDGFVLISRGPEALPRARGAASRAAALLPGGKVDGVEPLPSGAAAAFVSSRLDGGAAAARTQELRRSLGPRLYVTGSAAIQHDVGPVLARDLRVGELYLAVPAALVILLLVFGTASALLPFVFAATTISTTLGIAWGIAHVIELSSYLLNMVMMIGLGIAVDYSLLIVNRYRDERRRGQAHEQAVAETMRIAGRTIFFSGLAVALGLALMLWLPVPFLRGFGIGGLLIPLVSVLCALTLLPVLLMLVGERLERVPLLPASLASRRLAGEERFWSTLAGWVMRRAKLLVPLVAGLLLLASLPLAGLHVGPGSTEGLPKTMPAMQGLAILQKSKGQAVLDPITVLVDTGRAHGDRTPGLAAALSRLAATLRANREVAAVARPVRDASGRYLRLDVVGRHDSASPQAQALASDLRSTLIPEARFPAGVRVLAGGGGASAADFVSRTLGRFPWLILAVVACTYLLLVRSFRSLLLPLKAIALNLLTVGAASGLMIAVFQWGWGRPLGFLQVGQLEGWIPIFMFTLLFGLSIDYEVFLVHRMHEAWVQRRSNAFAVVHGLTHTGKIVTAAGLIMSATFSGFLVGSIGTLQQLGFGLAVAILIDITLVRSVLLPSTMTLAGRWNWYLPAWTARLLRA